MSNLTDWIPANTPPVRKGWYQRQYGNEDCTSAPDYWDGAHWRYGNGSPGQAPMHCAESISDRTWRGLASNPKAKP